MKKSTMMIALITAGLIGSAYAQDNQYWNGMSTSSGWNTTSNEWGATSGADVSQTWVDGNNAFIEADPANKELQESIIVNDLNFNTAGANHNLLGAATPTLTINNSWNMLNTGNLGVNAGVTVDGTFTITSANTGKGANDGRAVFNNGSVLNGNVTIDGNNFARLQMNGTSDLNANITLGGPNAALALRWNAGVNQTMGTLAGNGQLISNPGTASNHDTRLNVTKLELGTDGTLGLITSSGAGSDYVVDLMKNETHQFDLSKVGTTLDNDFLDLEAGTFEVSFHNAIIALNTISGSDALELGDTFTLISGDAFSGIAIFDDTDVNYSDVGYSFDTSNFNVDGTITVIPEPATLGLVAFAGGAIFCIRRTFMI
jgi:hypothetical protein